MKLLITSDIHIGEWSKFSSLDEKMMTSRSKDFLKLANLIKYKVELLNVDGIIIAGDLSDKPFNTPYINDIIRSFLEILNSTNKPIYLIDGNHDIATKTDSLVFDHSILKPLSSELSNINHPSTATIYELNSFKILLCPWTFDQSIPTNMEADILVAHQTVRGSTNPQNYEFQTGLESNYLHNNFKLSILGHIHKFQIVKNNILIPGSPIQNSFSDQPQGFIHIATLDDISKKLINIEQIDIYKEIPNTYHKFLYTNDINIIQNNKDPLIHYKLLIKSISSVDSINTSTKNVNNKKTNIKKFINDFIVEDMKSLQLDDNEKISRDLYLKKLLDNLKDGHNSISNIKINKVNIENFLSIKNLDFDFNNFSDKLITLVGGNGCFTGNTTVNILTENDDLPPYPTKLRYTKDGLLEDASIYESPKSKDIRFKDLLKKFNEGEELYTYTYNPYNKYSIKTKIINVQITKYVDTIIKLYLRNYKNTGSAFIECTEDHKFLLLDGTYKQAKDLNKFDNLLAVDGIFNIKKSKIIKLNYKIPVYDLTVDSEFSNFSITKNKIFVHNSGKTTLAESILWGLTGNLTKPLKVSEISHSKLKDQPTQVEIELYINSILYKITRSRKFNQPSLTISIFKDGQWLDMTKNSVTETQNLIDSLLSLTYTEIKLFSYFSSDSELSFNSLNKVERSNIVNRIFQVTELDTLRDIVKSDLNQNTNSILEVDSSISTLLSLINSENTKITEIKSKYSEEQIKQQSDKISLLKSNIENLKNEVKSQEYIDELKSKVNEIKLNKSKFTIELNNINSQIEKLNSNINKCKKGICPLCGNKLTDESHLLKLESELKELNDKKVLYESDLNKLEDETKLENEINIESVKLNKLNTFKSSLSQLESTDLNIELGKIKTSEEYIQTYTKDKLLKEIDKENLLRSNVLLKYMNTIFKKGSKLLNKLDEMAIELINNTTNEIFKTINSDIRVQVDLESCKVKYNKEFRNYNTLSKGQQRVADVSFMVALNKIFSNLNGLENGILGNTILDEVISFLDPEFTDLSLDILDQLPSNHVILITHNQDVIDKINNRIEVKLVNDFSEYKIINN